VTRMDWESEFETPGGRRLNAFTVDVEDYFQVSAFAGSVDKSAWSSFESRVERNTNRILDMLDRHDVKGTFFVLGWVAERHPQLVRDIDARGHEVACHGFSHDLVYSQTPETFREETVRSKRFLEDTTGKEVLSYRAASYSITRRSTWALSILAQLGFRFDSSIFPVRHDRYGIPSAPRSPFELDLEEGLSLTEFPLTTARWAGINFPVAGGGYFRLLPYAYTRAGFSRVNTSDELPGIFYLHPWEIDTGQPRLNGSAVSRFRHYSNIRRCAGRLERLLGDFRWAPLQRTLTDMAMPRIRLSDLT
jgi:polysaccharide deacetylase family protein (PEP-CTERM system associated)